MKSKSGRLVIYFAPHYPLDPSPLLADDFRTNYSNCDTFILDFGEQWYLTDPEKQDKYNALSQGTIAPPIDGRNSFPFAGELQRFIHDKKKRIVLERSPVPIPTLTGTLELLQKYDVDLAVEVCIDEAKKFAATLVERDIELTNTILSRELEDHGTIFMFRGSAHERHMKALLEKQSIEFTCFRFHAPPSRIDQIVISLTMCEEVKRRDALRLLHSSFFDTSDDEVDRMTESQLREELTKRSRSHAAP